jgi:hypothetical protein
LFYDVSDCRAWLVDGASVLVRASLYLDENEEEAPFDWVFDVKKLKDTWDGCTYLYNDPEDRKNCGLELYVKDRA